MKSRSRAVAVLLKVKNPNWKVGLHFDNAKPHAFESCGLENGLEFGNH